MNPNKPLFAEAAAVRGTAASPHRVPRHRCVKLLPAVRSIVLYGRLSFYTIQQFSDPGTRACAHSGV